MMKVGKITCFNISHYQRACVNVSWRTFSEHRGPSVFVHDARLHFLPKPFPKLDVYLHHSIFFVEKIMPFLTLTHFFVKVTTQPHPVSEGTPYQQWYNGINKELFFFGENFSDFLYKKSSVIHNVICGCVCLRARKYGKAWFSHCVLWTEFLTFHWIFIV